MGGGNPLALLADWREMTLILASGNKHKIKEFGEIFSGFRVAPYTDFAPSFEINENGTSFKENALIKARAVFERVAANSPNALLDSIVIADDSGISLPILNNAPGIFSARFAGVGASDLDNLNKLIAEIKARNLAETPAFYTAVIAVARKIGASRGEKIGEIYAASAHGWLYGVAIAAPRGKNGFGYDPIFIPEGYDQTLAELSSETKTRISHRARAAMLAAKLF